MQKLKTEGLKHKKLQLECTVKGLKGKYRETQTLNAI